MAFHLMKKKENDAVRCYSIYLTGKDSTGSRSRFSWWGMPHSVPFFLAPTASFLNCISPVGTKYGFTGTGAGFYQNEKRD